MLPVRPPDWAFQGNSIKLNEPELAGFLPRGATRSVALTETRDAFLM